MLSATHARRTCGDNHTPELAHASAAEDLDALCDPRSTTVRRQPHDGAGARIGHLTPEAHFFIAFIAGAAFIAFATALTVFIAFIAGAAFIAFAMTRGERMRKSARTVSLIQSRAKVYFTLI